MFLLVPYYYIIYFFKKGVCGVLHLHFITDCCLEYFVYDHGNVYLVSRHELMKLKIPFVGVMPLRVDEAENTIRSCLLDSAS
jgi:coenzyme F420-reducing hydrogenase delta subunit